MLRSVIIQPNHHESLRRALSLSSNLFYIVGHATPSEGIQTGKSFLKWQEWSQIYHQVVPEQLIFNVCYGQPEMYWQINPSLLSEVIAHSNLVERTWAMALGEGIIKKMIEFV